MSEKGKKSGFTLGELPNFPNTFLLASLCISRFNLTTNIKGYFMTRSMKALLGPRVRN